MDEQDRIYGTTELTPAVIRNARFPAARDGGYDPAAVHAFLEDVASAMDVLGSADAAAAIRRELQRTSDASSRVLLAGQDGAERLRAQASADAQAIIEEAKRLTDELRDAARQETARTREHIADLRGSFIEELRDMYDRIGATLYRFETASRSAADEGDPGAAPAPGAGRAPTRGAATPPDLEWSEPPAVADWSDLGEIGDTAEGDDFIDVPRPPAREPLSPRAEENPELKPAWTQLSDGAWDDENETDVDVTDGGADEPLGEGEPLVDLRAMREESSGDVDDAAGDHTPAPVDEDNDWLMPDEPGDTDDPTDAEPAAVPEATAPAPPPDDDQRAEAMIAGLDEVLAQTPDVAEEPVEVLPPPPPPPRHDDSAPVPPGLPVEPESSGAADTSPVGDDPMGAMDPTPAPVPTPVPVPTPAPVAPPAAPPADAESAEAPPLPPPPPADADAASSEPAPADDLDVVAAAQANHDAVRQFVLTSLSEGQPREAIENYLRESLGFEDAAGFIDESLQQG